MDIVLRALTAALAVAVIINGGVWEYHHDIGRGLFMALVGIVTLILVSVGPVQSPDA
jgi:hypothetical protein